MTKNSLNKYRENAFSAETLRHINIIGDPMVFVSRILLLDFKNLSREEYFDWVDFWRDSYKALSNDLRDLKRSSDPTVHRAIVSYKVLANTLLNARQYAKDVRRAMAENQTYEK